MAGGDLRRLTGAQHSVVERAVREAETSTGLQVCIYVGRLNDEDPRAHAESLFVATGLHDRPAILIAIGARQRKVEIVTSPATRERVSDDDAARAISAMTDGFRDGDLAGGLVAGVAALAAAAGPGIAPAGDPQLPDVIEE